uniref:Putative tick histamine binding protein n=1 Tax=Amblyomma tuberculatum TaxID=48802 RepID=A0A6M2E522_9ACAR
MGFLLVTSVFGALFLLSIKHMAHAASEDDECPEVKTWNSQNAWQSLMNSSGRVYYLVNSSYTSDTYTDPHGVEKYHCTSGKKYFTSEESDKNVWVTAGLYNGTIKNFTYKITNVSSQETPKLNVTVEDGAPSVPVPGSEYELIYSDGASCQLFKVRMQFGTFPYSGFELWASDDTKDNIEPCCLKAISIKLEHIKFKYTTYEKDNCTEIEKFWESQKENGEDEKPTQNRD